MRINLKFKIWKLIDRSLMSLLLLVLLPFKVLRKEIKGVPINPRKILAVEFLGFGDAVLTLPALKALKTKFPNSEIDLLTFKEYKEVLENQEYINRAYSNKISFLISHIQRYDLAVDFGQFTKYSGVISFILAKNNVGYSHGIRGAIYDKRIDFIDGKHMSSTFYDLVSDISSKKYENVLKEISYKDTPNAKSVLKNLGNGTINIGMHIGASTAQSKRCWPNKYFSEVGKILLEKNKKIIIVLFGTNSEKEDCEKVIDKIPPNLKSRVINLAGKTTLNEAIAIISRLDYFIGNDSGPMHIAASQNVPTTGIFAANSPTRYRPLNKKSNFIFKCKCKNRPCINIHKGSGEPSKHCRCYECYESIKPEEVLKKVYKNL
jgi:ADP-heptose:LPS heptosyltransferase